jgi:Short C-terminal domain
MAAAVRFNWRGGVMLGFKSLEQKLRDGNGRTAPATVLELEQGKSLNFANDTGPATHGSGNTVETSVALSKNQYLITVRPEGEPEFETVVKAADDAFPASVTPFRPRTALMVLFDPDDHQRVAIDVAATRAKWDALTDKKAHEAAQAYALTAAQSAPAAPDVTEQLARLADLRDRGALTEQEFAAEKAKLLAAG